MPDKYLRKTVMSQVKGCDGGGLVVSVLALYSDDTSLNLALVNKFVCNMYFEKNEDGHFK